MSNGAAAPSVCVALVTFNRKHLLLECLDALLQQSRPVQAIFIVDNGSTDGTVDLLQQRGYLQHASIKLCREEKNTGGAGGFSRGLELGRDAGFNWIWLMDDDAEPAPDALEVALSAAGDPRNAAIANYKISAEGVPQGNHMLLESGEPADRLNGSSAAAALRFSSFVGLLVRGAAISQAGLPRAEFFLNQDDAEYCMRLRKVGRIVLVPGSVIRHKEAARSGYVVRSFLGVRHARPPLRAFVLRYFEMRNTAVLYGMQHGRLRLLLHAIVRAGSLCAAVFCYRDDQAWQRVRVVLKAYLDAVCRKFDNDFPFRVLREIQPKAK